MVFEQSELESAVLDNFSVIFEGQRVPIFPIEKQTDQAEVSLIELEQLLSNSPISFKEDEFETKVCSPYSFIELEEALQNLPTGKASGYDDIPNELLRQSSHKARLYLQTFLNKIIEDGEVPQDLNVGKCMLIFNFLGKVWTKSQPRSSSNFLSLDQTLKILTQPYLIIKFLSISKQQYIKYMTK